MCRASPLQALPPILHLNYGNIQLKLRNMNRECGFLTYNDACTMLRGLAEYMTSTGKFQGSAFDISVSGNVVRSGQLLSPGQGLNANMSSIAKPGGADIGTS